MSLLKKTKTQRTIYQQICHLIAINHYQKVRGLQNYTPILMAWPADSNCRWFPTDYNNSNNKMKEYTKRTKISPFMKKIIQILDDKENRSIIRFNRGRKKLIIFSKKKMQKLLPKYFKHQNFESFSRQLNWYGFVKIRKQRFHVYKHQDLTSGKELKDIKSRRKWKNKIDRLEQELDSHEKEEEKQNIQQEQASGKQENIVNVNMPSLHVQNEPQLCYQPEQPQLCYQPEQPQLYYQPEQPQLCYQYPCYLLPPFYVMAYPFYQ